MSCFCPLASGSKGNAIFVSHGHTKVLIDAGLSAKMLESRLGKLDVHLGQIDAIVITHEHTDHIRGLGVLALKHGIPVVANSDTARAIHSEFGQGIKFKIFSTGEPFTFGDIQFFPFTIQHDAVDPVGFTLHLGPVKIGVAADLGFVTPLVKNQLKGCDFLYLEANHQEEMVYACARPLVYKERVLSRLGHLSNRQCGELLKDLIHPQLKHVYLAHLSSECNAPDLAQMMIEKVIAEAGASIEVSIALQDQISKPLLLDTLSLH